MKRSVILLSLVGVILGSGAFSQSWLHGYTEELTVQMEELSRSAQAGEAVLNEVRAVHADWEECQRRLGLVTQEEHLDQVETHIKRAEMLAGFPDNEVYRRELVLELLEAADAAEELWEKERISFQNII